MILQAYCSSLSAMARNLSGSRMMTYFLFGLESTLPKTNSSPLKIGRAPKGNSSSNHPFSGANLLLVSGRVLEFLSLSELFVHRFGGIPWILWFKILVVGKPSCKNTHQSIFLVEKILGNIEQFFPR